MKRRFEPVGAGKWQCRLSVLALMLTVCAPTLAHHQVSRTGQINGVEIPAITHGEMLVVARHRSEILDLANRQARSDQIFRQLMSFVGLQYFACFWGLVPGSLIDDDSPFNECSHAYLAGTRALLTHLTQMDGKQSAAIALLARIDTEVLRDPTASAVCSNSVNFESGTVVWPDWGLAWSHLPTLLSLLSLIASFAAGLVGAVLLSLRSGKRSRGSQMIPGWEATTLQASSKAMIDDV